MFCQAPRITTDRAVLPESPLCCPRGDFYSVCNSQRCTSLTLKILSGVRHLVHLLVDDCNTFDYETIRTGLLSMPSTITASEVGFLIDYYYESCRLAALLMIEAIDSKTSYANLGAPLVDQIKSALQRQTLDYWGIMSGVFSGLRSLDLQQPLENLSTLSCIRFL